MNKKIAGGYSTALKNLINLGRKARAYSHRWELKKIEVRHPPRSFASLEDDTAGGKTSKNFNKYPAIIRTMDFSPEVACGVQCGQNKIIQKAKNFKKHPVIIRTTDFSSAVACGVGL